MANNSEHDRSASQHPDQVVPAAESGAAQQPDSVPPVDVQPTQFTQPTVSLPEAGQAHGYGQYGAAQQPEFTSEFPTHQLGQTPPAAHSTQAPHVPQAGAYQQPAPHGTGAFGQAAAPGMTDTSSALPGTGTKATASKSRTGMLLAGLAIGALLGGVVGGGVAAVVSTNTSQQSVAQGSKSGTITLNNAESTTAISGVAAVATPSVVTLEVSSNSASGSGSGVIYSEDGYIVTNAHVVTLDGAAADGGTIRVKLSDGRILDGDLVGVDPYADLAVVKVKADGLPAIDIADSDKLNVGDLTVAIGAPLNLANTVTSGVVSALNRGISVGSPLIPAEPGQQEDQQPDDGNGGGFPWDFRFGTPDQGQQQQPQQSSGGTVTLPVIQTDASINPGNSGGALLNGEGQLIGINVAIASTGSSQETAGSVGLGFAIPVNLVTRVADAIIDGEQPSHGLLGASVADSSQDATSSHTGGLLVDVARGGAADKGGLKAGDIVTAIDGAAVADGTSVSALVRVHEGGSTVKVDYIRNGKAAQTEVTLGSLEW